MPVYFYFQKTHANFITPKIPVPFEVQKVNVGGGMNNKGVFTAPRAGLYSFSLQGAASFTPVKNIRHSRFYIHFYLNGKPLKAGSYVDAISDKTEKQFETFSLQTSVNLKVGDKIWLEVQIRTKGAALWDDIDFTTHYNGWLVEEDLSTILKIV